MANDREIADATKVLTYWRTLEFLQQDEFVVPSNNNQDNRFYYDLSEEIDSADDEENRLRVMLLASLDAPTSRKKGFQTWGDISLYFGLVRRQDCVDKLVELLEIDEADSPIEENLDEILLGCFKLTSHGEYKTGSLCVSTMLWAISKLVKNESKDLDGTIDKDLYKSEMEALEKVLFDSYEKEPQPENEDEEGDIEEDPLMIFPPVFTENSITISIIKQVVKTISGRYRACLDESPDGEDDARKEFLYMKAQFFKESETKEDTDDFDTWLAFDFFSSDLKMVRDYLNCHHIGNSGMPSDLLDYILVPEKNFDEKRFDVIHPKDTESLRCFLSEALSSDRYPLGKWPSRFSPALMQQLAINYATSGMKMPVANKAVFSVNGPPGTGKTTLLNEIIAANVVNKATLLARYDDPDKAFDRFEIVSGPDRYSTFCDSWYKLRDDRINDYSIVVTSYNNKAVENITKNLPLSENLMKCLKTVDDDDDSTITRLSELRDLFTVDKSESKETLYRKKPNYIPKEGDRPEGEYKDIYFSEYARDLLGNDAWGLVSVPLGKKANINEFYWKVLRRIGYDLFRNKANIELRKPKYQEARNEFVKQYRKVEDLRNELIGTVRGVSPMTDRYVDELLDSDNDVSTEAHVRNPWLTDRYNYERIKLFRSALVLTKEFVLSSYCCWTNLKTLAEQWGFYNKNKEERPLKITDGNIIAALYQTLLLLVPAVSSTFASIGNMFGSIKEPGTFGTLIVDEAGQSEPFAAVGALFRARRAIIVGDPKQLEPVVTDDTRLLNNRLFQDSFFIPYKSPSNSVQSFADAINPIGSYLKGVDKNDSTWVGSPLVVHRRCIDPMFTICNLLSYDGMMKNRTMEPPADKKFLFGKSLWINCSGKECGRRNHFVETQGRYAVALLEQAFKNNPENPSIYVISPFKTVISGLKRLIGNMEEGLKTNKGWLRDHIGTVHTVQGREADEVIFILGCEKDSCRAMKWVNANLVNVAVSRARYRLYIIGDADAWEHNNELFRFILSEGKLEMETELPLPKREEVF